MSRAAGRALVTGGAGFIGSHVVDQLLHRGWSVVVFDDLSNGLRENVAAGAELVAGDVRDSIALGEAASGCTAVFHLAALGSVPRSIENPALTHDVNVEGTYNVLLAARAAGARVIVLSSSSSVYGDSTELPKMEERVGRPLSPYGASKRANEIEADGFAVVFPGSIVALRYFNVYGPRQRHDSPYAAVVPLFFRAALAGESPVVYGDGLQSRDFTYVGDVARANLLAVEAELSPGRAHVYNVGAGGSTSVLDLWSEICRLTGCLRAPRHAPPRPGDVRDSRASVDKAARELGYEPETSLAEGLAKSLRWYRQSLVGKESPVGSGPSTVDI
ncbi:MAG TPA: NAD-dependent epimerase/dehydratase family protein [Thermoanaerobaculia bacterium]